MKVHYINILLFALPLNILVINQRNHNNSTYHTSNTKLTKTHRTLCECELYAPSNYENDPEMKELMENFNHQSSERFREYDERIQDKRKQFKEQCEKDIQKIILKDKIEKELTEKLSTLQTDISTNDIPTCVCEKSLADKMEKTCLKCGGVLGTAVPELGLIGGSVIYSAAQAAAAKLGVAKAIELMKKIYNLGNVSFIDWTNLINVGNYSHRMSLVGIVNKVNNMCQIKDPEGNVVFCFAKQNMRGGAGKFAQTISEQAGNAAIKAGETANVKFAEMTSVGTIFSDPIVISATVVVTIAVILIIIYLILRYRRKKKMKKKLQYIKLLEE
ncbi:rifin [Plasmodium falciparum NF54]|uniref:Rifin n=2 Tax=Plasmodium falciparum TaxID=5833 RepID=Q8I210_PLAF7|nr:rifin [Plasmodium falciparum 3D7]EWC90567.1 hypothetical protein PFNF54_00614 [Plasmodium falciparum NF54]KAF4330058.1 rifin [Plasmodium falciparum NF54]PKC48679.1 rifin [Plasmodium falciparum NF54]CAD49104.1 rifin [Plasmodium falciparum 3D7]|eukprot:XP_001351329.1 rifin [Plasmodium falciparum 3D7]